MTPARPRGQAEGRGRVSFLLQGLGNYSDYSDPGGLSEFEGERSGRRTNTHTETPTEGQNGDRENIQAETQTQNGETERKGQNQRKRGSETERDRQIRREGEEEREREGRMYRSGEARGAARPGYSRGNARAQRPSSGRCPAARAARPALDPPGFRCDTHLPPALSWLWKLLPRNGNPRASLRTDSGRSGVPRPPRAAPTSPAPASAGARRRRLGPVPWAAGQAGGEARSRGRGAAPAAEASGSRAPACRPGQDLPRAAAAAARSAACPPVPAELSAGSGGGRPGGPGRLGEAAGRAGGGPARLGWAARRAVCGPGRARGAGERRASGSDVRGVSAPNRERGRGQRREGREQERAGGRARPLPPGAQEGRLGRPGPRPLLPAGPEPWARLRRGPTALRSCRCCPSRCPRDRAENPAPSSF